MEEGVPEETLREYQDTARMDNSLKEFGKSLLLGSTPPSSQSPLTIHMLCPGVSSQP